MGRFIAFDRLTASEVSRHTKRAPQLGHGDPLKAALASDAPALLLLESGDPAYALRIEIKRPQSAPAPPPILVNEHAAEPMRAPSATPAPVATHVPPAVETRESEAYGFLGLSDTPMLSAEEDEPKPVKKKSWWKR